MIEVIANHRIKRIFHENEEKSGEEHFHPIMKTDIIPYLPLIKNHDVMELERELNSIWEPIPNDEMANDNFMSSIMMI